MHKQLLNLITIKYCKLGTANLKITFSKTFLKITELSYGMGLTR